MEPEHLLEIAEKTNCIFKNVLQIHNFCFLSLKSLCKTECNIDVIDFSPLLVLELQKNGSIFFFQIYNLKKKIYLVLLALVLVIKYASSFKI